MLERSGHRVPPGQRWAGRRAGPSQAEPLPPPSKHRGETRRPWRPGRPAGCPPQGLSPGLWSAFRGKVAQSVKCKVKQSQRTLGETRHSARQDSSTEARRPGGRPPELTGSVTPPVPSPGPSPGRSRWGGRRGRAAAEPRPAARRGRWDPAQSFPP